MYVYSHVSMCGTVLMYYLHFKYVEILKLRDVVIKKCKENYSGLPEGKLAC